MKTHYIQNKSIMHGQWEVAVVYYLYHSLLSFSQSIMIE